MNAPRTLIPARLPRVLICALLLALAATASARAAEPQKVTIGYSRLIISLPIFVAESQGMFKKHGLAVELVPFDTAQPLMDALISGQIDVAGYTAYPITFNAMLRSKKQLYFLTNLIEDDAHPISKLLVKNGSPISSVADLKGKRVGILPTLAYKLWLEAILKANDIDPGDVAIQNLAPPLTPAALDTGTVDAAFTNDPAATAIVRKNIGHLLYEGAIVPKYLGSPFSFASFNISKEFADKNPAVAKAVAQSLDEAIAFIDAHPLEARGMMAAFVSSEEKDFVEHYSGPMYRATKDFGGRDLAGIGEACLKQGLIKEPLDTSGMAYSY